MAAGGRQAQVSYFGSDVCFELILEIAQNLGPGEVPFGGDTALANVLTKGGISYRTVSSIVLFPSRVFEGIMSEQKLRKVHQNSKDKELGAYLCVGLCRIRRAYKWI